MSVSVKRLFKNFVPKNYQLFLEPDRDKMTFSGRVTIEGLTVGRPSKRLYFHQKDLKITAATIVRHEKKGDRAIPVSRINLHKSFDEVRLHTDELLFPGDYTVMLEFSGKITRPMNGIYPCFFKDGKKEKKLIATQFESHHAREVFPCIDEPEAKATFDLTLVTPAGEEVLANTMPKKTSTKNGKTTTTFETTPVMSTYLLAIVYGELGHMQAKTKRGTLVRTFATKDNVAFTKFALETGVKVLEFYEDYFDVHYPLEKADMVALPDFAAGAMENWGLITYREHTMLVDPENTSVPSKQLVAMVVAHELAHQWFGNLVTMRWWTDLWLNEGFASWIEYLAVDTLFPDWGMWTQFVVDEMTPALKLDALEHTHPIEVPVNHPDEIRIIFDTISYNKGSSVINMLHQYLGAEPFRDGLRHYLKHHAYGNTDTIDLWESLGKVSGKPVKDFMHAWTSQPGYPVITAEVDDTNIQVHQERFYLNHKAHKTEQHWPVPLLTGGASKTESFRQASAHVPYKTADSRALKLNQGQSGFYRTVYDTAHLARLQADVAGDKFGPEDHLGLISDSFEAAKAGFAPTVNALKLMTAYSAEQHASVWDIIALNLGEIRRVMDDDELRDDMKPYIRQLVADEVARLDWEPRANESYFDTLLRPLVLALAAGADEPKVVDEALKLFKDKKPEDIDPDIRGVVFGTAARLGGKKEFDQMLKLHNETTSSEVRLLLCGALTSFEKPAEIKRALAQIDGPEVRLQDAVYWLVYSFMNRHAKHETWEWFKKHWQWLEDNFSSDLSFGRLPMYVARAFSDEKFLKEYKAYFADITLPALDRAIKQGIETLEWQIDWKRRDFADIKQYFKAQ